MLTKEQLRIAGEAALTYPPGHGYDWGFDGERWRPANCGPDGDIFGSEVREAVLQGTPGAFG